MDSFTLILKLCEVQRSVRAHHLRCVTSIEYHPCHERAWSVPSSWLWRTVILRGSVFGLWRVQASRRGLPRCHDLLQAFFAAASTTWTRCVGEFSAEA
eukprot:686229-Rhodomonas_salina.1